MLSEEQCCKLLDDQERKDLYQQGAWIKNTSQECLTLLTEISQVTFGTGSRK